MRIETESPRSPGTPRLPFRSTSSPPAARTPILTPPPLSGLLLNVMKVESHSERRARPDFIRSFPSPCHAAHRERASASWPELCPRSPTEPSQGPCFTVVDIKTQTSPATHSGSHSLLVPKPASELGVAWPQAGPIHSRGDARGIPNGEGCGE